MLWSLCQTMRRLLLSSLLAVALSARADSTSMTPAQARERLEKAAVMESAESLVQYAAQGDIRTVGILLAAGLTASARDPLCKATALHSAAALGQVQVVDLLLRHQAEVNAQDWRGLTPLINAVHGGHAQVIERLLKAGARVDVLPAEGPTALLAAVHAGRIAIVRMLLDAGASPTQPDAFGTRPLDAARQTQRDAIAQLFAERT
ncbi:ankyrin repeat domain-containing protein [Kinneretia aquatilis]|uniref:ankyrin repeat domain-containing protein n=1 Tax=Kinneretia aquatilis TaxID=2070761 RepID=UPI001CC00714|nr:ankyrin repeat domain-containing protein [Paucibacter aquatile]WIW00296.1 ankyrin repeat domain-containing protein [Paucibacter aquatile]